MNELKRERRGGEGRGGEGEGEGLGFEPDQFQY